MVKIITLKRFYIQLIFSSISHKGLVKKINQDKIKYLNNKESAVFIVCDGLSGLDSGEIASEICSETIISFFSDKTADPKKTIEKSLLYANKRILDNKINKMGSTVALVYIQKYMVYAAWCGDSRIYHIRDNEIKWMSKDHIVLHDLLNKGYIKGDLIYRPNALTRYIGNTNNHNPEIINFSIKKGDVILISSDGLHNFIRENEIIDLVSKFSPTEASEIMKNKLLEEDINAPDNFSWFIVNI